MKNNLKVTGILLVIILMALSGAVATNTTNSIEISDIIQIKGNIENNVILETTSNNRDVLWDNGPWQDWWMLNAKGENTFYGKIWVEMADDFVVGPNHWLITDAHFVGDGIRDDLQVESILVRFFESEGDLPSETAFREYNSTYFTMNEYYDRIEFDVDFFDIMLSPGNYWVQFTPVGCENNFHLHGYTTENHGADSVHRDGDPTGEYGGWYGSYTWFHNDPGYDMSFRLNGISGDPPTVPIVNGPQQGKPGEELCWTFESDDPNGDQVQYLYRWTLDSNASTWDATPLSPPNVPVEGCLLFGGEGLYEVWVFAVDEYGLYSDVYKFDVLISKSRNTYHPMITQLLELFPNAFPFLRYISGLYVQ